MFKEVSIKTNVIPISLLLILSNLFYACGGNTKQSDGAAALLDSAQQLFDHHNYNESWALIDSINKAFPSETKILRKGMYLRTLIQEKKILEEMGTNDSILANSAPYYESISNNFSFVKETSMPEGYRVSKYLKSKPLIQRSGIEPRIDESGNLYIISLLYGNAISHTSLKVISNDGSSANTRSIPYDGSQNYHFKDNGTACEMIHFNPTDCEEFAQFISNHANDPLKLVFTGNGVISLPMDANLKKAIAESYRLTHFSKITAEAKARKIYLTEKLKIAQRQKAKTMPH